MLSTALVAYFTLALVVSFCCSLFEATILSTAPSHVERLVREDRGSGRVLKKLRERIDRPLIAILTLNTVANMFGAAGVGAEAGKLAAEAGNPALWVSVASGVLTLSILVFSEIVPKTLGARYWRVLAAPCAYPLQAMVLVLAPIVRLLEFIPKLVAPGTGAAEITREDLQSTAELVRAGGDAPKREVDVILNMLRLGAVRAKDVLTPRVELLTLPESISCAEAVEQIPRMRHSRIPVFDEPDKFTGIVLRAEIHEACLAGRGTMRLAQLRKPVRYVPETSPLSTVLERFIGERDHVLLVVDEHGSVDGLITLEDVIETLLGVEIVDEFDTVPDLQERARKRALHRREQLRATGESAGASTE